MYGRGSFEEVDRRMLVAEDGRQSSIGHLAHGAAAQSGKCGTDRDPKNRAKIHKTKYIVVDQDPPQWRPLAQNLIANRRQHHIQVEPHNRELNHSSIIAPFQQNLAAVYIPLQLAIEDFYHDRRTVELLHRNRHVTIVNQKPLVRLWSEQRRDVLDASEKLVAFGKQRNQLFKFIRRVHVRRSLRRLLKRFVALVRLKRNLPLPSGCIKRLPLARKASAQNHQHAAVAFPLLARARSARMRLLRRQ
jgi:hypothetical protein